jgi:Leucine-rich repeat (LRR) protein
MYVSFQNLKILEYLDVSFNQIDLVDRRKFDDWGDFKEKPLKYLNLESNRIRAFDGLLFNLINLDKLFLTNNDLAEFPRFRMLLSMATVVPAVNSFFFNFNKIKSLRKLPFEISSLSVLNFDYNQISSIEDITFQQLKNLQTLSISNNFLTRNV